MAACQLDPLAGPCTPSLAGAADTTITAEVAPGLVQRLSVSNVAPCQGEDIMIQSELEVTSAAPMALSYRICGLDLDGALDTALPPDVVMCQGINSSGTYPPGSKLKSALPQRVQSEPGTYTLSVRHALAPSAWLSVPVTVRSR